MNLAHKHERTRFLLGYVLGERDEIEPIQYDSRIYGFVSSPRISAAGT